MKLIIYIVFQLFFAFQAFSQTKHDFNWVLGYPGSQVNYFGGTHIDFNSGNPQFEYFPILYTLYEPIVMSNDTGQLQFYSSACNILNRNHVVMQNGGGLNPGFYQDYCEQNNSGYISYQGLLSLPIPNQKEQYIMLHFRKDVDYDTLDLMATYIDMSKNNGLGKVGEKIFF